MEGGDVGVVEDFVEGVEVVIGGVGGVAELEEGVDEPGH